MAGPTYRWEKATAARVKVCCCVFKSFGVPEPFKHCRNPVNSKLNEFRASFFDSPDGPE